ncbi:hypothetical protein PLICRDRAFT_55960 [Plicaturopsis crispa FD-325 SS-3]|nr:hypothetical protein PLICRDRAFT_55960 [Plicaturopsis crispa FD-325 SS-3]
MHRCLRDLDILHIVFSKLRAHDLPSVARTCKAFSSPALDHIWRDQDGFKNILQCMSADLWKETKCPNGVVELSLQRPITLQDWSRLDFYADRINSVSLPFLDEDYTGVDSASFIAFILGAPRLPLLRRVHTLHCNLDMPHNVCPLLRLLLGPNIIDLTAQNAACLDLPIIHPSFHSNIFSSCRRVRKADLSVNIDSFVGDLCSSWPELEHLNVGSLTGQSLQCISTLPALREIKFAWNAEKMVLPPTSTGAPFPALRGLDATVSGEQSAPELYNHVISLAQWPHLDTLQLSSWQGPEHVAIAGWHTLFHSLNTHCSTFSLTSISIACEFRLSDHAHQPIDLFDITTLRMLFPFRRLVFLHLSTTGGFALDDAGLEEMARAWPSLQTLWLGQGSVGWLVTSQVTVFGLATLLRYCPELQNLRIVLDASKLTTGVCSIDKQFPANNKIKKLSLANSPIENPAAVAAILSDILPNLTSIVAWTDCIRPNDIDPPPNVRNRYRKRWQEVENLVKYFVKVREDERERRVVGRSIG